MQAVSMQTRTKPASREPVGGPSGHALATAASLGEASNAARMDFGGRLPAARAANGVLNAHQPRARPKEPVAYPGAAAEQRVAVRELGEPEKRPDALGARLLPWVVLLIAAAGCSAVSKDQSTGAVAERWALAIRNADARSYMSEIAPEAFRYRARLVSSDPGWFVLGRSEEAAVVSAFFRAVRYVSGTARVESAVGDDAVVSIGLDLVDAYQKGGRDQLRYRVDATLRLRTAVLGGERRIVSIDEEPPRASTRRALASLALVKLLQSDMVDVQEREERPRNDTIVLVESVVERSRGTKLIEVRYTTVSGRGVDAATPMKAYAEVVDSRGRRIDNVEVLDWEGSRGPDRE